MAASSLYNSRRIIAQTALQFAVSFGWPSCRPIVDRECIDLASLKDLRRKLALLAGTPWPPDTLEQRIYHACIEAGDVCYDVGANVGDTALLFAALAKRSGYVLAIEPSWKMYRLLSMRIQRRLGALRSLIVPVPFGLADQKGELTLSVPNELDGLGSFAPAGEWSGTHFGATLKQQVCQITTVDALIAEAGFPSPTFMKIDVEGAELLVLRGARELFKSGNGPLMVIEMHEPWQRAFNYEPAEPVRLLKSFGYQFLCTYKDAILDTPLGPDDTLPSPRDQNVVAFLPEHHATRIDRIRSRLRKLPS